MDDLAKTSDELKKIKCEKDKVKHREFKKCAMNEESKKKAMACKPEPRK